MSRKRQAERKAVRCQAIVNTATAAHQQCTDRATGYIRLPAKAFVCAEHRKVWRLGGYMRFANAPQSLTVSPPRNETPTTGTPDHVAASAGRPGAQGADRGRV